jgi:hypothetical protein
VANDFNFERAGSDGWVFAKSTDSRIFLFGPNLESVQKQISGALAALEIASRTTASELPEWHNLAVA